jgi:hypothetical protein
LFNRAAKERKRKREREKGREIAGEGGRERWENESEEVKAEERDKIYLESERKRVKDRLTEREGLTKRMREREEERRV